MLTVLAANNHKFQLERSTDADIDVIATFVDFTNATPPVAKQPDTQLSTFNTAATGDIVAAPSGTDRRVLKHLVITNKDTTTSCDVALILDANGTDYRYPTFSLAPGDALEYVEGVGFFKLTDEAVLNELLVTTADVVNATTSWADITGLTSPVKAGRTYMFEAALLYVCNATTTGARFGVNGPESPTYLRGGGIGTVTGSVTAAAFSTPTAAVSAYDTSMIGAQTTGPATEVTALVEGVLIPSADGTFAMRSQSEVAVANGVTIRRGSRLHIREADNA